MKFYNCLKILASKGVKLRNLDFKTFNLLFERVFSNSPLSCCNRVCQVYVSRRSTHEILYRRRKLGHKTSGFAVPKTFRVDNVYKNVRSIQKSTMIKQLRRSRFSKLSYFTRALDKSKCSSSSALQTLKCVQKSIVEPELVNQFLDSTFK